jgi:hypothetical protein
MRWLQKRQLILWSRPMSHYFLTQTAGCIVASAADFIKIGRSIPGIKIEGPWDAVLAGQQPYEAAIATVPNTVTFLNSLSLEDRTTWFLNLFETDPRYECARSLTKRTAVHFPITMAVYIESAWRDRIAKNW